MPPWLSNGSMPFFFCAMITSERSSHQYFGLENVFNSIEIIRALIAVMLFCTATFVLHQNDCVPALRLK